MLVLCCREGFSLVLERGGLLFISVPELLSEEASPTGDTGSGVCKLKSPASRAGLSSRATRA